LSLSIAVTGCDFTPIITNVKLYGLAEDPTAVIVAWRTDEPSTSKVEYGLTTDYGSASEEDDNLTTRHAVVLTGLTLTTAGTLYHFRLTSVSGKGKETTSGDLPFTIYPPSS
jgi:hypothetical protein